MKTISEKFKKIFSYSIGSIILISLLAALFGFIKGNNLLKTILNANYIASTVIIAVGIFGFLVPIRLKKSNRLVDHSNIVDVLREEKDIKLSEALVNISWGICHIILVGILEIVIKNLI